VFEQLKASHSSGDLNDRKTLCEALAYQNYLDSPPDIQSEAEKIISTEGCDCVLGNSIKPEAAQCCLGAAVQFEGEVAYCMLPKKVIFPKPGAYAKQDPDFLLIAVLDMVLNSRRNVLFISDWKDDVGNTVLPTPEQVNCGDLARELGLCWTTWNTGKAITIIAFDVELAYKPTWLDSGLAFYWYAAPRRAKWGLARSLETGRPTLREWVLPKRDGAFKIAAYWDREVEQDYNFAPDKLCADYWKTCAKELRS